MSDSPGASTTISRRTLVKAAGGSSVAAVAGCVGGDGGTTTSTTTDSTDTSTQTQSTTDQEQSSGGTLTVANESKLTGLDPHRTASVVSWNVIYNICETLTTFKQGKISGRLAESWSIGDDGKTYTFKLKEGVQFHPPVSRELVADDVVYSFNRMQQKKAQMSTGVSMIASIEAASTYEVEMTLKRTFAPWVNFLARIPWVVVPEEAVENQGGGIGDFQKPVGTGPFAFEEHVQGDHTTLTAFDDYREDGVPLLDAVKFIPVPDGDSRKLALRDGDVQFARGILPKDAGSLDKRETTNVITTNAASWGQVYINCSEPPWDDPAVRRAVAHVFDRPAVIKAGLYGYGTARWQPFPDNSFWHTDLENARKRNVEKAKQILADAGNPLDGETLEIKTTGSYPIMLSTATVLAQNLNQAGIDAEINKMEWGTMLSDYLKGNYTAMAFSIPHKVDPDRYYYNFIHPDSPQYVKYTEDQPDAQRMYDLMDQGRTETDPEKRKQIYGELQELVNKNVPWISVGTNTDIYGMRSNVSGDPVWLLPYNRFWKLSLE